VTARHKNVTSTAEARPDERPTPARPSLRHAAQAALAAWTDEADRAATLEDAMDALRPALGERIPRTSATASRPPRESAKQAQVLAILRRDEGAMVAQIAERPWAGHRTPCAAPSPA
jgi:hypothetical protein